MFAGCVSLPKFSDPPDLERGACTVTFPDRDDICLEVPFRACVAAMGEYGGDGSTCEESQGYDSDQIVEPSPLYLDKTVIYSVGGTATAIAGTIATILMARKRRKKRGY